MLMLKILHGFVSGNGRGAAFDTSALPAQLAFAASASENDLFYRFHTSARGLNREAVALSREDHGRNVMTASCEAAIRRHLGKFAFSLSSSLHESVSGFMRRLAGATARVERSVTGERVLTAPELVAGDIVRLAPGDVVPADVRLIEADGLSVNETALAGRATVSRKNAERIFDADCAAQAENLVFAGSIVVKGTATGIVVAVGEDVLLARYSKKCILLAGNEISTAKPSPSREAASTPSAILSQSRFTR